MSLISVVLLTKVTKNSNLGEIIKLKRGYVRNYLIPRGKVVYATKANIEKYEALKGELLEQERKEEAKAKELFLMLNNKDLGIIATAGSDGKLFGSITPKDIMLAIKKNYSLDIEKKDIVLEALIKVVGTFSIGVKLHHNYTAAILCHVAPSESEIEALKKKSKEEEGKISQESEGDKSTTKKASEKKE